MKRRNKKVKEERLTRERGEVCVRESMLQPSEIGAAEAVSFLHQFSIYLSFLFYFLSFLFTWMEFVKESEILPIEGVNELLPHLFSPLTLLSCLWPLVSLRVMLCWDESPPQPPRSRFLPPAVPILRGKIDSFTSPRCTYIFFHFCSSKPLYPSSFGHNTTIGCKSHHRTNKTHLAPFPTIKQNIENSIMDG